jgi:hypothetical protein
MMRGLADSRVQVIVTGAAALLGGALVALPWVGGPGPAALPAQWGTEGWVYGRVVAVGTSIDQACAEGDLDRLRSLLTPDYLASLADLLRQHGHDLGGDSLRRQRRHLGDFAALQLVVGLGAPRAAACVFSSDQPQRDAGYPARRALLGLRFAWDGYALRLDARAARSLLPGDSVPALGRAFAAELLESR